MSHEQTIYALSSGNPPAGLAVIRVSGPAATLCLQNLTNMPLPEPRKMMRTRIYNPADHSDIIDDAMAVIFRAPASFTGEDCLELHVHGGRAVVSALLDALSQQTDCRLAEPGEFTRRAFENGKLDLSEAEGVADLIAAETQSQRHQALRQMEGQLGTLCKTWAESLKKALAYMEATIDFSDEDLPDILDDNARSVISTICNELKKHLDDNHKGQRIRDGIRVVIIGPPNAGKSSLINYLSQREAAIVSDIAGTTRDVVEVHLDIAGFAVVLSDTAGLRESSDVIEREGVRRAQNAAEAADIRVVMFDGTSWPDVDSHTAGFLNDAAIGVVNKVDTANLATDLNHQGHDLLGISVKTEQGIQAFLDTLQDKLRATYGQTSDAVVTRARHREAFSACADHLLRALMAQGAEFWAEDMRLAMRELGKVTGQVGVEDLLDVIFHDFCIGK